MAAEATQSLIGGLTSLTSLTSTNALHEARHRAMADGKENDSLASNTGEPRAVPAPAAAPPRPRRAGQARRPGWRASAPLLRVSLVR